ncbi:MAG: Gfo/Idh/MocA family protein [Pseudonocardiaceae bacterium]
MTEIERIPAILVGAGKWVDQFWVPFLTAQPYLDVVAVVDINQTAARPVSERLGTVDVFGSMGEATSAHPELVVALVISNPEVHADLIVKAAELGLDVVTEKPAALTVDGLRALQSLPASFKAVVIQNYRYEAMIQTLRGVLTTYELGAVHGVSARFAADYRVFGSWDVGDAHEMSHPMLLEGSIHHFDMMRYLVGADASRVVASEANPAHSSFKEGALVSCIVEFSNGVLGTYEASLLAAGRENRWHHEYYRLDCQRGSIEFDGWQVRVLQGKSVVNIEVIGDPSARNGHLEIVEQYVRWRTGGPVAETALVDNLKSVAMVMAAVESIETGGWCDVDNVR